MIKHFTLKSQWDIKNICDEQIQMKQTIADSNNCHMHRAKIRLNFYITLCRLHWAYSN